MGWRLPIRHRRRWLQSLAPPCRCYLLEPMPIRFAPSADVGEGTEGGEAAKQNRDREDVAKRQNAGRQNQAVEESQYGDQENEAPRRGTPGNYGSYHGHQQHGQRAHPTEALNEFGHHADGSLPGFRLAGAVKAHGIQAVRLKEQGVDMLDMAMRIHHHAGRDQVGCHRGGQAELSILL